MPLTIRDYPRRYRSLRDALLATAVIGADLLAESDELSLDAFQDAEHDMYYYYLYKEFA